MNDLARWADRHPKAAKELFEMINASPEHVGADQSSEAYAQQQVRLQIAKQGGMAWRNNVGATPSKCKSCGAKQVPVRYGLANESTKLNKEIKSSDLILAIPRIVTMDMVGTQIAQFGAVECKKPGWVFKGDDRETAQLKWLTLVKKLGGFAQFSTGGVEL